MMEVKELIRKYPPKKENVLMILHEIQSNSTTNSIQESDLDEVVRYLNTTKSHVYGVLKYYTMYSNKSRAANIIRVCNSPVCNMMGSETVLSVLKEELKLDEYNFSNDGKFYVETSECLGHCDKAPMMMINDDVYGDLNQSSIIELIRNY